MAQWVMALLCIAGLMASAATLYSTNNTLHQLKHATDRPAASAAPGDRVAKPHRPQPAAAQATSGPLESTPHAAAVPAGLPALHMKLLGTILGETPATSLAVIEDGLAGTHRSYGVGEMIQGRQLLEIARGYVTLASGDREERVALDAGSIHSDTLYEGPHVTESPASAAPWEPVVEQIFGPQPTMGAEDAQTLKDAIRPVSETERAVDRGAAWNALKESPFQVLREASLQPVFEAGALVGVQLSSVPQDGVLRRSGFEDGDVIRAVNGQPVTNPLLVMQLPAQLQQADAVEVQIERRGQPMTLTYRLQ